MSHICLMVPSGEWNVAPIVEAIRSHRTDCSIVAVWCGDPHRRPVFDRALGVSWCDLGLDEPNGFGWGRLLVALEPEAYSWSRTACAVRRLLDGGAESVVVLRLGSAAVLGDVASLIPTATATVVPRVLSTLPVDGFAPSESDVIFNGSYSTAIAAFAPGAQKLLADLENHAIAHEGSFGPLFERVLAAHGAIACDSAVAIAVGWDDAHGVAPMVIDVDALDRAEPWHLTFGSRPARVRLSNEPLLAAEIERALPQRAGTPSDVSLPGGIAVDHSMRTLVRQAVLDHRSRGAELPPEPFGPQGSAFTDWLETPSPRWGANFGRYWRQLRVDRADLAAAFPKSDSFDQDRYATWIRSAWTGEPRSSLVRVTSDESEPAVADGSGTDGLNLVGYLTYDVSLGGIAREVLAALDAAEVPVAPVDHRRTSSPRTAHPPRTTRRVPYATTLAVVNADQFEFLVADHGAALLEHRKRIGYWFWELRDIPPSMTDAIEYVDEIWVGSAFVKAAFETVTDKPVRHVPLPVAEPLPSTRSRASFGFPDDRFVFLATFDHFSVAERKNPYGVVRAFRDAFEENEGPLLVVKSINGATAWQNHERLLLDAAGRADIRIWDEHLSKADQMAVVAAADCLVSLHRSEGLGLHCAEAMWLAKPVIATRYSGNLDFMDDDCSLLVDYTLINVEYGEGVYPSTAQWADPDLAQAGKLMRDLAADPTAAASLGERARQRMQQQPTRIETGRLIARLAGIDPPKGRTSWD